jgi:hypothetical protein
MLSAPSPDYAVVAGDVALPTVPVLQVNPSGQPDPAARLFAKWGLVVRIGADVDIRVAPGWEQRARIGWGSAAIPAATTHVRACPPAGGQAGWLAFAGGSWVAKPVCLPLIINSGGRYAQVRLGVGVACPTSGNT